VRSSALTNYPARGYEASLELQPRAFMTRRGDVVAFIADELEHNKMCSSHPDMNAEAKEGLDLNPSFAIV